MPKQLTFYFDVGSPYAYLASTRVDSVLPEPALWQPVLLGGLFREFDRGSWALTKARAEGIAEIEERAAAYGLPPIVWPDPLALYAKGYPLTVCVAAPGGMVHAGVIAFGGVAE